MKMIFCFSASVVFFISSISYAGIDFIKMQGLLKSIEHQEATVVVLGKKIKLGMDRISPLEPKKKIVSGDYVFVSLLSSDFEKINL